jgi:SulP family sulfate permease
MSRLSRFLPFLRWLRVYDRRSLTSDLVAAVIVTVMLIPQSLAYALLAGLPPETGLYASILPLAAYALFGTSMTMAVGPVAVISLMTAAAAGKVAATGAMGALEAAILLAWISGSFLLLLGVLRVGFVANFLSHPVVAGFITASGIIIALGQLKHLLGVEASGDTLPELLDTLWQGMADFNAATLAIGGGSLLFLLWARSGLKQLLLHSGLSSYTANLLVRIAPVFTVLVTVLLAWQLRLDEQGVALMGAIPSGLPKLQVPDTDPAVIRQLLLPAIMLSVIGYVESVSVGKTLAARRRQKIDPDQELIGLGAANIASGLSGGFPVTGGFSRSVVNFDAGAQTPAASFFTAIGIGVATLLLTGFLAWLPNATLAATIIIAVLGLVDFSVLRRTWDYSLSDFIAVATTMGVTLLFGVEIGVTCGVGASLMLHLYKTSRPHIAEVGEVPGTEHFRNIKRHQTITHAAILSLRIDERLYFANASYIEDEILAALAERPHLKHVILMCTAVNEIDISALEVLEGLSERLRETGIGFHLSEVKGPVMDKLKNTHFLERLNGKVFLSQHQAVQALLAD